MARSIIAATGRRGPKSALSEGVQFSVETLEKLAADLKSKKIPLDRISVSDDVQPGLRVIVRDTGAISFHVQYEVDGARPYLKIGEHPGMSIKDARYVAKTCRALAERGIDVQKGLHERLVSELLEKGEKWRP